jgi:hypothetical protein
MLSKKDKEWIKDVIKTAVTEALTVEWTIEKVRDEKTGLPLAVVERKTEEVFIPSVFIQLLSYHEGALRGMQEQTCKHSGKIDEVTSTMKIIGNIVLQTEKSLKQLAAVSDHIKQLDFNKVKELEYDGEIIDES